MRCRCSIASFLALALIILACRQPLEQSSRPASEQYISVPNAVPFDIEPVQGTPGTATWLATYSSQGKTAKFKLEFGPSRAKEDEDSKRFGVRQGEGRFLSQVGSDPSVLLQDLKNALRAKTLPKKIQRQSSLPFVYVSLGDKSSQAPNGGFNVSPPGSWTPIKLFIGKGEGEGQVFVNVNPTIKKGQFSIKDEEYGDIVLAQLATVL